MAKTGAMVRLIFVDLAIGDEQRIDRRPALTKDHVCVRKGGNDTGSVQVRGSCDFSQALER